MGYNNNKKKSKFFPIFFHSNRFFAALPQFLSLMQTTIRLLFSQCVEHGILEIFQEPKAPRR